MFSQGHKKYQNTTAIGAWGWGGHTAWQLGFLQPDVYRPISGLFLVYSVCVFAPQEQDGKHIVNTTVQSIPSGPGCHTDKHLG